MDVKITEIKVVDVENRVYILGEKIGQGGQGAVFHVKDDADIAIKLSTDKEGNPLQDDTAIKNISYKLNIIRKLPLPQNINLSKPLSILKSHAGYVMTFMNEMKSFESFLKLHQKIEDNDIPRWLKNEAGVPIQDAEVWVNFCKTGSIRTRLLALYKVSELLANLHARGLVYGDISGGNLMYKELATGIIAGLIDTDNINFAGKSKTYFTPGFGAPEITNGKSPATVYSDSYAFAVAAFYILTMLHPFKGKKVLGSDDNDDDDWANSVTVQQKADPGNFNDTGMYPWIFNQNDDSNSYGDLEQVNSLFLTPLLFALFDNTFSTGHNNPKLRTPLIRWPKAFAQAADLTIRCSSCGMTYYYDYTEDDKYCCPYCSTERCPFVLVKTYIINNDEPVYSFVHEIDKEEFYIPSRCFESFKINESDNSVVGISLKNGFIALRLIESEYAIYIEKNNLRERFTGVYKFKISDIQNFSITLLTQYRKVIISGGELQ